VNVFASAEQFLESDHFSDTDCLILDVRMQGMNGLELQRKLATNHCEIPVVFVTAHGDEDVRARALNAGAVDYLLKPFSEEALLNAIDSALKSKGNEKI
jgi:FixJ family two-component response regulator